jgi:DNA sulfur modification protein DndB
MIQIQELPEFQAGTGTPVAGIPSSSDPSGHFIANIPVGQLLFVAPDPMLIQTPRFHLLDARLASLQALREDIQRLFVAAKKRNLSSYTEYVIDRATRPDRPGILPAIKLYWPDRLTLARSGTQGVLVIPFQTGLVAMDGETQLAAWHAAARREPAIMGHHIDITIDHGKTIEWAKQAFHDLNVFGVKPNPTLAIFMDYRDPVNKIAKDIADSFFAGRVETQARQVSTKTDNLFTMAALRLFVVCLASGTAVVANATKSATDAASPDLGAKASAWLSTLQEHLPGEGMASRRSIFTVPPMVAALGAAGHEHIDPTWLRDIEWERDAATPDGDLLWDGIAGKRGRQPLVDSIGEEKASLAVGGPKEYVHSCFRALTDPESYEFRRVRPRLFSKD